MNVSRSWISIAAAGIASVADISGRTGGNPEVLGKIIRNRRLPEASENQSSKLATIRAFRNYKRAVAGYMTATENRLEHHENE